jgi:hypothetical protein
MAGAGLLPPKPVVAPQPTAGSWGLYKKRHPANKSQYASNCLCFHVAHRWFVLLLLLDDGRLVSGPPIHAQFLQAFAKTALRNQLISSIRRQDGL